MPMKPTLAIAEDDDVFRFVLAKLFRCHGYGVLEFHDGNLLAEYLLGSPQGDMPVLVVADVVLPGMTGLAACSAARIAGCTAQFIFMSTFNNEDVLLDALALGPAGIFRKPFDVDALCVAVDEIISATLSREACSHATRRDGRT